jgi:putative restriction endonuclease
MAKGVFVSKINPAYDDLPEIRYHFPRTYLAKARETVGDWIVYYESRRDGGRQVYFATARVTRIESDRRLADHYYAFVDDYLQFPHPVPFREGDTFFESALRRPDGGVNKGLFGRAIHHLPEDEYQTILSMGMGNAAILTDTDEPEVDADRPVIERLTKRAYRDRVFTQVIRSTYRSTCALTGLRLVNGGGRCEIEAAHIRAVEQKGPDSPRNGIALSRTLHWMFDRHIIALEDDGKILLAKKLIPEQLKGIFNPDGYARFPDQAHLRPHPQFLNFHREQFKG